MKNKIALVSLLFLSFLLPAKKIKWIKPYVPAYLKQMLPYTSGQAIRFIDSNGGIIDATISMNSGFTERSNCASCPLHSREEYRSYFFSVGTYPLIRLNVDVRPVVFMSIYSPQIIINLAEFRFYDGRWYCTTHMQWAKTNLFKQHRLKWTNLYECVGSDQWLNGFQQTHPGLLFCNAGINRLPVWEWIYFYTSIII